MLSLRAGTAGFLAPESAGSFPPDFGRSGRSSTRAAGPPPIERLKRSITKLLMVWVAPSFREELHSAASGHTGRINPAAFGPGNLRRRPVAWTSGGRSEADRR